MYTPTPEDLAFCRRHRRHTLRSLYIAVGWCVTCTRFLLNVHGDRRREAIEPVSLPPLAQLWHWKTEIQRPLPMDLSSLPAGRPGSRGTQPREMDDWTLRVGRISLLNVMDAISPEIIRIVPAGDAVDVQDRQALYTEPTLVSKGALYRIVHRAQFYTLAWACRKDYENPEWRWQNRVPMHELKMPHELDPADNFPVNNLVSFGFTPEQTPPGSPGRMGDGDGDNDNVPRPGVMETSLQEHLAGAVPPGTPQVQQTLRRRVAIRRPDPQRWHPRAQRARIEHVDDRAGEASSSSGPSQAPERRRERREPRR